MNFAAALVLPLEEGVESLHREVAQACSCHRRARHGSALEHNLDLQVIVIAKGLVAGPGKLLVREASPAVEQIVGLCEYWVHSVLTATVVVERLLHSFGARILGPLLTATLLHGCSEAVCNLSPFQAVHEVGEILALGRCVLHGLVCCTACVHRRVGSVNGVIHLLVPGAVAVCVILA